MAAYRLRNTTTGAIVDVWGSPPSMLSVPGVGDVHGITAPWTGGDYVFETFEAPVAPVILTASDVNAERDRRLALFWFGGTAFNFGGQSTVDIAGAGTLALAAIINGAQPGNLRWADANADFRWIAASNASVPMDAQTCFAFAQAAAKWRSDHIHAARVLKDSTPIPADYAANAHWPS